MMREIRELGHGVKNKLHQICPAPAGPGNAPVVKKRKNGVALSTRTHMKPNEVGAERKYSALDAPRSHLK